jgi:hypothetical protein
VGLRSGVAVVALVLSAGALGCGGPGALARPTFVAHPRSALFEVPYPPPPGRVESVTQRPRPDAVWIDGQWSFEARSWRWQQGGWVIAPAGARFAPWATVRSADGRLFFAPATWYARNGAELPPPPVIAPARRPRPTGVRTATK